jgi:L-lactate dehydrogenase complex protein LldG
MTGSRDEVLASIQRALAGERGAARSHQLPFPGEGEGVSEGRREQQHLLTLFEDRLVDYEVRVLQAQPREVAARVLEAVEKAGLRTLVLPRDIPGSWLSPDLSEVVQVVQDGESSPLSKEHLAGADGVLTGCALAVAETGTVILDGGPAQGRRVLSLLPDYHLCVVGAGQVVEGIPYAVEVILGEDRRVPGPLTFISGPSATSDIELVRVRGVHGPRTLEVILVAGAGG